MSTDDPRDRRDEETTDWPLTPPTPEPPARGKADATIVGGDGETTTPVGAVSPTSRPPSTPPPHPGPPPARPAYVGPDAPRPWTLRRLAPTPPADPRPSPAPTPPRPPRPSPMPTPPRAPRPSPATRPVNRPGHVPPQHLSQPWSQSVQPSTFDPRPTGNRNRYVFGAAAAVAIAVAVAAVVFTRGGGDTTAGPASATAAASSSQATAPNRTTATAQPAPTSVSVEPARLPQLLLPADAISTVLASPGMVAAPVQNKVEFGTESTITPMDCDSTWAPGKTWTYQLSGFIGMARQPVAEAPTPNHSVVQAVLAFPDPTFAQKSYDTQVRAWGKCQNQTITAHLDSAHKDQTAVIGAVAEAGGVATLQLTPDIGLPGVLCERALSVAGNVVVDVRSCSPNVGDTAATLARDIVAKINDR